LRQSSVIDVKGRKVPQRAKKGARGESETVRTERVQETRTRTKKESKKRRTGPKFRGSPIRVHSPKPGWHVNRRFVGKTLGFQAP